MRWSWWVAAVLVAACSDSGMEPVQSNTDFAGTVASLGGSSYAGSPLNGRVEVPCPGGGKRVLTGQSSSSVTGDTQSSTWQMSAEHLDCVLSVNGQSLVTNGSTQAQGQLTVRLPAQGTQRPVILALQAHDSGTMTTKVNGETHTCSFDLRQTYNATANTVRITGTACGQAVEFTRSLN